MNLEMIALISLVVDDSAIFRKVMTEVLSCNFPFMEIVEAGSGKEALQIFESRRPQLVFMDIGLPDLNGLVVTRQIRKIDPCVAVIILTNHDTPEYREAAKECGAGHFISKASSIAEEIRAAVICLPCVRDKLSEKN